MAHIPVLLHEVIEGLNLKSGDVVVDGTLGEAGHAKALADIIGPTGHLIGVDADGRALARATKNLAECEAKFTPVVGNFRQIEALVTVGKVQGVLLDLGVNSGQLDDDERGFSFRTDTPLVMTLSDKPEEALVTAYDVVNSWGEENLANVIYGYGEERFSRQIAEAIAKARQKGPIKTTWQLVDIIKSAVPKWYQKGRLHPATKTFQAIRIAVNDELEALKEGLAGSFKLLDQGGRLAVISFHSLEARIVKEFFKELHTQEVGQIITKKAIKPTREEQLSNPRSRSAQLRIIQKI